jgi:putative membrane protein
MSWKRFAYISVVVAAMGCTSVAVAQTATQKNDDKAPVAGANSFTEGQAKSHIESAGFSQVTNLRKDDQGIWRANAMREGKQVSVSLDFRGNIVAQ